MRFTSELDERGVREREFRFDGAHDDVPGILWEPSAADPEAIVLLGHGGSQHKRDPGILSMARRLVRGHGFAAMALDHLPGHGDRPPGPFSGGVSWAEHRAELSAGGPEEFARKLAAAVALLPVDSIVDEWRAALSEFGRPDLPAGYVGFSGGGGIGFCLVADEPRIGAAALGLAGSAMFPFAAAAAPRIDVPLLCFMQWDDELIPRSTALELFDLVGSTQKTLHANPGSHVAVPAREIESIERFVTGHLRSAESLASR